MSRGVKILSTARKRVANVPPLWTAAARSLPSIPIALGALTPLFGAAERVSAEPPTE